MSFINKTMKGMMSNFKIEVIPTCKDCEYFEDKDEKRCGRLDIKLYDLEPCDKMHYKDFEMLKKKNECYRINEI